MKGPPYVLMPAELVCDGRAGQVWIYLWSKARSWDTPLVEGTATLGAIAEATGLSVNTVRAARGRLVQMGLMTVIHAGGGKHADGSPRGMTYHLVHPRLGRDLPPQELREEPDLPPQELVGKPDLPPQELVGHQPSTPPRTGRGLFREPPDPTHQRAGEEFAALLQPHGIRLDQRTRECLETLLTRGWTPREIFDRVKASDIVGPTVKDPAAVLRYRMADLVDERPPTLQRREREQLDAQRHQEAQLLRDLEDARRQLEREALDALDDQDREEVEAQARGKLGTYAFSGGVRDLAAEIAGRRAGITAEQVEERAQAMALERTA